MGINEISNYLIMSESYKIKKLEKKIKEYNCLVQWVMDDMINELKKLKDGCNINH